MPYRDTVSAIYRNDYAEMYDRLYIAPWQEKHQLNLKFLQLILRDLTPASGCWLDICCGQAWHFSQLPCPLKKIGVDLSEAQLARAASLNPEGSFIRADVAELQLRSGSVALATSFWGAYCYLDDEATILGLFEKAISWIRPGGAMYLEVMPPEPLMNFNMCAYAGETGFRVSPRTPDYRAWSYEDPGGIHLMTSPPLEAFVSLFQRHFERVQCMPSAFMVNLVARNRLPV